MLHWTIDVWDASTKIDRGALLLMDIDSEDMYLPRFNRIYSPLIWMIVLIIAPSLVVYIMRM